MEKPLSAFFAAIANDYRISSTHISVFAALLHYRNDKGFTNPIHAYSADIMKIAKLSAAKTIANASGNSVTTGICAMSHRLKKTRPARYFLKIYNISPEGLF